MPATCCILNSGGGAWAFEGLATQLAAALWVDVSETSREFNYLLFAEDATIPPEATLFIPYAAMKLAADKRLLAECFLKHTVPTPETLLIDDWAEVERLVSLRADREWCLKYPLGCGGSGHRLIEKGMKLPGAWPRPFVVQEFVRLESPEVYRIYIAGGTMFGWVARRFPRDAKTSPWVAHARGARYVVEKDSPAEAQYAAQAALSATGLANSFGCVDLMRTATGEWVVLEVGTDGMFNHVDRDLGNSPMEEEIQRRIAIAFWKWVGETPPWGEKEWRAR